MVVTLGSNKLKMNARRKLFDRLKNHIPRKEFTIITGARQTGKTTLMRQLRDDSENDGHNTLFLNLENKDILKKLDETPLNLLSYLPDGDNRIIVFIDEIQYLNDPSNFLKLIYDEYADRVKIVATGSSAFYIDTNFKDSLAGRKRIFHLYTCSFDEYLDLGGKQDLLLEYDRIRKKDGANSALMAQLKMEWEDYMIYGGYPAIITELNKKEKIEGLKEIRDSFVKRDVIESGVSNETAFYNLFRLLAEQSGNLVNVNELASTLRVVRSTIENYLFVMEKCFHIKFVRPFYQNLRKELVKMPKIYLLDTGLRNCLLNNFLPMDQRADNGHLWENMLYRSLMESYQDSDVKFWRTADGKEVDFVLPEIDHPKAIEAKLDSVRMSKTKYKKFIEGYPEIGFQFSWMYPFDEDFFRRLNKL